MTLATVAVFLVVGLLACLAIPFVIGLVLACLELGLRLLPLLVLLWLFLRFCA